MRRFSVALTSVFLLSCGDGGTGPGKTPPIFAIIDSPSPVTGYESDGALVCPYQLTFKTTGGKTGSYVRWEYIRLEMAIGSQPLAATDYITGDDIPMITGGATLQFGQQSTGTETWFSVQPVTQFRIKVTVGYRSFPEDEIHRVEHNTLCVE